MLFSKASFLLLLAVTAKAGANAIATVQVEEQGIPSARQLRAGLEFHHPNGGKIRIKNVVDHERLHRFLESVTEYTDRAAFIAAAGTPDYTVDFENMSVGQNWDNKVLDILATDNSVPFTFEGTNPSTVGTQDIIFFGGSNVARHALQHAHNVEVDVVFSAPVCAWGGDFFTTQNQEGTEAEVDVNCPGGDMVFHPPAYESAFDFWGIVIEGDVALGMTFRSRNLRPGITELFGMDDIIGVYAPEGGKGTGDPHFQTWSGLWYDYHGQCDLVYLDNAEFGSGDGLTIHIRTSPRYVYSYIETAAIQIGEDTLEISAWGEFFVNGVANSAQVDVDMPEIKLAGKYAVNHTMVNKKRHLFEIDLLDGQKIVVTTHKDLVSVVLEGAQHKNFHNSVGLLGSFGKGDKLGRDGKVIEDDNLFGQEWQVRDTESKLFQTERHPQYPTQCIMPGPKSETRRLGQTIAEDTARAACAHWADMKEQCVFDVMVSGDLELAELPPGAY